MRHRVVLSLALAALAQGCISVPSYPEPDHAKLRPGFDPTAQQRGRWLCGSFDFVRVASGDGDVVVEMNNDIVVGEGTKVAGGTAFDFRIQKAAFHLLVPDDPQRPLTLEIGRLTTTTTIQTVGMITYTMTGVSEGRRTIEKCAAAPKVQVLH